MRIGDEVYVKPEFTLPEANGGEGNHPKQKLWGRIVYIHPAGRFYTVEFRFPSGAVRESFRPDEIISIRCK